MYIEENRMGEVGIENAIIVLDDCQGNQHFSHLYLPPKGIRTIHVKAPFRRSHKYLPRALAGPCSSSPHSPDAKYEQQYNQSDENSTANACTNNNFAVFMLTYHNSERVLPRGGGGT